MQEPQHSLIQQLQQPQQYVEASSQWQRLQQQQRQQQAPAPSAAYLATAEPTPEASAMGNVNFATGNPAAASVSAAKVAAAAKVVVPAVPEVVKVDGASAEKPRRVVRAIFAAAGDDAELMDRFWGSAAVQVSGEGLALGFRVNWGVGAGGAILRAAGDLDELMDRFCLQVPGEGGGLGV